MSNGKLTRLRAVVKPAKDSASDLAKVKSLVMREADAIANERAFLRREEATSLREDVVDLREKVADLREKALRDHTGMAREVAELGVRTEAQLREANERLVVATVRAQTLTEAAERTTKQMTYMAEHDFLTGLPNRALLCDRLERSIALAKRQGHKVALMYLDLDHFKHINDSLGHTVGDQLLQSVTNRLQECVRLSDTVSRQGGDEFVVMLPEVEDSEDAVLTAQKLITAMALPHFVGEHRLHVTLSIGISVYPDDGKDVEAVLRNADTAMFHAKRHGRNKYQVFTPAMNVRAVARQSIEVALHRALEQGEFVLHYQPKVNLETGAITGAEALIRWQRANNRLVSPTQFVGIAEDCGLILPIGKWVLREACRQTQAWLKDGLNLVQIAVNVSPAELRDKDFLAGVRHILKETGLDPHTLELELTESGLMQDTQQTTAVLGALKELGVHSQVA